MTLQPSKNDVMRLFEKYQKQEQSKLIEKALTADLKSDPSALLKLSEEMKAKDPEYQRQQRERKNQLSQAEDKMILDDVKRATNKAERKNAIVNLQRHLEGKYGNGAPTKLIQLLKGEN